jgi:exonuclease SbcC
MISAISLTNYQSHKSSKLEFCESLNCIVGTSDSGKTAVLRALKWILTNRPLGNEFQSNWGGKTEVILTTKEGNTITRSQSESGNDKTYIVNDTILKAFGTDVPSEVLKVLNMDSINCQYQLDSPFLLTSTPGEVASHWNKIAHLDQIDTGLSNVKSWITKLNQTIESKNTDLKAKQNDLEGYNFIDKYERDVSYLEELESALNALELTKLRLKALLTSYKCVQEEIEDFNLLIKQEGKVNNLLALFEEKRGFEKEADKLDKLLVSIVGIEKKIKEHRVVIKLEDTVDDLLYLVESRGMLEKERDKLDRMLKNISRIDRERASAEKELGDLEEEFHKNMPKICPLCGK